MKGNDHIKRLLVTVTLLVSLTAHSQHQATWVNGSSSVYIPPAYGTKGVAAPANNPGSRHRTTSWTDNTGKFWLFGGSNNDYFNDLWMYDPSANLWTWVSGDNTTNNISNYGMQGVASPTNIPGGRYAALSWTATNGDLYLFGGFGYASGATPQFLNDFWKYSIATNEWTWISGDNTINNTGIYGTKGTSAGTNKPGARYGAATWIDGAGNLWMMGGKGYGESLAGDLNDVWKYDPSSNEWTWVNGDKSIDNPGIYGTKGTSSPTNKPGSRNLSAYWKDAAGNFWVFGGEGYANSTKGNLNDLWKYDPVNNVWTWVSGDNAINSPGVYGTKGIPDAANVPAGRQGMNGWIDNNGVMWIFGGYRSGVASFYNDLWAFDPVSNEWTWLSGGNTPNQAGTYGTQGTSSPDNIPGARFVTGNWTDAQGFHWIFGGTGYSAGSVGFMNDLWKLKGCLVSGTITPATAEICPSGNILLTATGGVSYQWSFNGSAIAGAVNATYTATAPGTYSVMISNGECAAPAHNDAVISLVNLGNPDADFEFKDMCVNKSVDFSNKTSANGNHLTYTWSFGDNETSTDEHASHVYTTPGDYKVELIATSQECATLADTILKTVSIKQPTPGLRYSSVLTAKNVPQQVEARPIGKKYEWLPPDHLSDPLSRTPVLNTDRNEEYRIRITDEFECFTVDTLLVLLSGKTQVSVPNAFTPDGNGRNDLLKPVLINVASMQFSIFNRTGQVVFKTTDLKGGWDGRFNGVLQPQDSYVWLLIGKDYEGNTIKAKGILTLIR